MMKIHFREQYGTRGEEVLYVTPAGKNANLVFHFQFPLIIVFSSIIFYIYIIYKIIDLDQESIVRVPLKGDVLSVTKESFGLRRLFQRLFLPQGYPDSVSNDYIHYQIWDTVQAFCSTITGNYTIFLS